MSELLASTTTCGRFSKIKSGAHAYANSSWKTSSRNLKILAVCPTTTGSTKIWTTTSWEAKWRRRVSAYLAYKQALDEYDQNWVGTPWSQTHHKRQNRNVGYRYHSSSMDRFPHLGLCLLACMIQPASYDCTCFSPFSER